MTNLERMDKRKGPHVCAGLFASRATPTGLEPATSAVTGRRANQLRYGALVVLYCVSPTGFEPVLPP